MSVWGTGNRAVAVAVASALWLAGCATVSEPDVTDDVEFAEAEPVAASAAGVELGAAHAQCEGVSHVPERDDILPAIDGWLELSEIAASPLREDWAARQVYSVQATDLADGHSGAGEVSLTDATAASAISLLKDGAQVFVSQGTLSEGAVNPAFLLVATTPDLATFFVGDCRQATWRTVEVGIADPVALTDAEVASLVGLSADDIAAFYDEIEAAIGVEADDEEASSAEAPRFRDGEFLDPAEADELVEITVVISATGPVDDSIVLCSGTPDAVNECAVVSPAGASMRAWAKPGESLAFFFEPAADLDGVAHHEAASITVPDELEGGDLRYVLVELDFDAPADVAVDANGGTMHAPAIGVASDLVPEEEALEWPELQPTEGGEEIVGDNV